LQDVYGIRNDAYRIQFYAIGCNRVKLLAEIRQGLSDGWKLGCCGANKTQPEFQHGYSDKQLQRDCILIKIEKIRFLLR
jgi:hypothetical protein